MGYRLNFPDQITRKLTSNNSSSGKKLHLELRFLQAKYPQAEIEVWAMDEHRY
jgi:hypothetical protein